MCVEYHNEISLGEILASVLTLLGFGWAMWQWRKGQKETWYLNVIVLPNIDKLNETYKDLIAHIEKAVVELSKADKNCKAATIRTRSAKFNNDAVAIIDGFFEHFGALVSSYDKNMGKTLREYSQCLQDECSKIIEKYHTVDAASISGILLNNKKSVLEHLHCIMRK